MRDDLFCIFIYPITLVITFSFLWLLYSSHPLVLLSPFHQSLKHLSASCLFSLPLHSIATTASTFLASPTTSFALTWSFPLALLCLALRFPKRHPLPPLSTFSEVVDYLKTLLRPRFPQRHLQQTPSWALLSATKAFSCVCSYYCQIQAPWPDRASFTFDFCGDLLITPS